MARLLHYLNKPERSKKRKNHIHRAAAQNNNTARMDSPRRDTDRILGMVGQVAAWHATAKMKLDKAMASAKNGKFNTALSLIDQVAKQELRVDVVLARAQLALLKQSHDKLASAKKK